jgi:hypothetical protein
MYQLINWPGKPCHTTVNAIEYVTISYEQSYQRGQVIDLPKSLHVGFAGSDTATENNITPETAIAYRDPYTAWEVPGLPTKLIDPVVINDNELSELNFAEQIE